CAVEAPTLREIRSRSRRVNRQFVFRLSTNQRVNRFFAKVTKTIPDREIDCADRLDRQALPTVRHRRTPHLIPDEFDVARILSFDKTFEMFLDDVAGRFTADAAADTGRAVSEFDLDHDRAERIDTPTGPLRLVLFVHGHR